ncbi:cytochrome P450 [Actinoplanes sp. NBRC 103695]|uniref:cytochrome P450 n=1 Tax=Actinoplanes sp. NBRC 103695 TaxID=3032202 RepID=UPI0024A5104D|nr:cytochrome P450 [Actinoplanes sp. NBRC 103695]GLZ00732.1 cytochrome P450 [Actinoplanes sp. NBRC 103695]
MTDTVTTSDIDLWAEDVVLAPYETYRKLRDLGPAVWLEQYQAFVVTRYRDVYDALHDHDAFASGAGVALNEQLNQKMKGSAVVSDPPYHDHVRGVMAQPLTPRALRAHKEDFQRLADDLIDRLLERGTIDVVVDFAQLFPLSVVPDLLGWPTDGRENFLAWASAGFNALGPMNERARADIPVLADMWAFMAEIAQPGRLRPGSWGADLVEAAQQGTVSKQLLPALIGDYLVPSLDTTVSALSSAMLLLGRHPDQWRAVRADHSLIPAALNEVIRYESPIRSLARVLTRDRELSGTVLPAGSRALMMYASANRDERYWTDPDDFDITRPDVNAHVGFGHGIHGCVGQGLARLEGHALLTALAKKVRTIEVGEPEYRVHNTIRAIAALPATLHAA